MFLIRAVLVFVAAVFGGFGLHAALMQWFHVPHEAQGWITLSFFSCIAAVFLFAWRLTRFMKPKPKPVLSEAELERRGLLRHQTYQAKRSLMVEEFEDEGPHVYLELADGCVLFLNGQYLYESVDDRTFPCANFRVSQRKAEDKWWWGQDVVPMSPYVAPQAEFPPYEPDDWKALGEPCDGEIIKMSFDELKSFFERREMKPKRGLWR